MKVNVACMDIMVDAFVVFLASGTVRIWKQHYTIEYLEQYIFRIRTKMAFSSDFLICTRFHKTLLL